MTSEYCLDYDYPSIISNNTNGTFTAANASSYSESYYYGNNKKASNSSLYIDWTKNEKASEQLASSGYSYEMNSVEGGESIVINCTSSNITLSNRTYELKSPVLTFDMRSAADYYRDSTGKLLNKTWLEKNSQCQVLQTYQWGFSSLLLFSFCLLTILFFITILALQVDVWCNSQTNRMKQEFSLYRDILDFAHQLRTEIGSKVEDMPAKDLEKSVKDQTAFVSVAAYEYPPSRAQERRSRKKAKEPFNFRTDSIPRLRRIGSELKAGHAYSMGEMKRSLGMTYGPVRKQTGDSMDFA